MVEHRGAILFHSSPGAGTTCRVLLPSGADAPAVTPASPAPARAARGNRRGRAFVVEDEPRIRALVVRHLEAADFEVVEAADGEAALRALGGSGRLALAVPDLVLPRRSGREVFEALRVSQPDVAVLVTSGFVPDEALERILADPATRFLEKPWRPSELEQAVERLCG